MRPDWWPELSSSYTNQLRLLYASGWVKLELGVKLSRSQKNGTIYVQKTLKKRKTAKSDLRKEAGAGTHDMIEEDFVDESDPAVSSTLSKKKDCNEQTQ